MTRAKVRMGHRKRLNAGLLMESVASNMIGGRRTLMKSGVEKSISSHPELFIAIPANIPIIITAPASGIRDI